MSEQLYTVEKILDKRTRSERGNPLIEYKVKWQGYSEEECTWQPKKNLKYVQQLVDEYQNNQKKNNEKEKEKEKDKDKEERVKKENFSSLASRVSEPQSSKKPEPLFYYENDDEQEEQKKETKIEASLKSKKGQQMDEQYEIEDIDQSMADEMEQEEEPYAPAKDYQPPQTRKKQEVVVKKQAVPPPKKSKNRLMQQQSTTPVQKPFPHSKKKKPVVEPIEIEESYKSNGKESIHQKIQEIQNRIRIESKSKPIVIQKSFSDEPVKILEMARGKDNHYEFLTQQGELLSYRTRDFLFEQHPDELISFYESKINFGQIPKISL